MKSHALAHRLAFVFAVLWIAGATAYWVRAGWQLGFVEAGPALLGGFPVRQLAALVGGLALGGMLTFAGWMVARAAGWGAASLPERAALAFLIGGGICGTAGGWIAFVAVYPGIVPLIAIAAGTIALRWGRRGDGARITVRPAWPELVALGVFASLALVAALAAAVESDGLRYHLVAPREWLRAGRFVALPYNVNANLPAMQGLLVAQGLGTLQLGRVYQVTHCLHAIALAFVCGAIARRIYRGLFHGRAHRAEAWIAASSALAAFAIPTVGVLAAWPFSDVAAAAYLFGGIWLAGGGGIRSATARHAATGLLLGAALAAKISLLPVVGIVGLAVLARIALRQRRVATGIAAVVVCGVAALGPWLVKSSLYHGNPVYPLAYSIFGGPEWSPENEAFYSNKVAETGMGRSVQALLMSPVEMTRSWIRFEKHNPGPMLLAMLPLAFGVVLLAGLRRRFSFLTGLLLAVLIVGWLVWWRTYQSVRFFLPQSLALVVLGVPCAHALAARAGAPAAMRIAVAAMALAGATWAPTWRIIYNHTYRSALGIVGDDVRIAANFNAYPAVLWLNANSADNEPVFYIGEHRAAYAKTYRPVASDWFDTPLVLVEIRASADNDAMLADWRRRGIRRVLLNQAELGLYEARYFQPRFSAAEWQRFEALRTWLLAQPLTEVSPGIYVIEIGGADGGV